MAWFVLGQSGQRTSVKCAEAAWNYKAGAIVHLKSPAFFFHMLLTMCIKAIQRFSRAGPRGRGREWATLGVHPLSWLLSNNRLEEVCSTLTKGTFSSRLLLSNQDKGCTPSVAHSLPLPLGPALLNLSSRIFQRFLTLAWHIFLNR